MEYLVLRTCYVNDRYFTKGEVKELPDDFPIYEKNFSPVGVQEAPLELLEDSLVCPVCGKECKSKFGLQSHMRVH